jgi:hypothetical protein
MSDLSFSLLPNRWPRRGRVLAVVGSVLLHASLLPVALNDYAGARSTRRELFPHYRVQFLQLETRNTLVRISPPIERAATERSSINAARLVGSVALVRAKSFAKQTLIVGDAPPDLKLDQPIPLPFLLSWTEIKPVAPPEQEQRQQVDVISVPDPARQIAGVVTVPKVNQIAADIAQASSQPSASDRSVSDTSASDGPGDGRADAVAGPLTRIDLPRDGKSPISVLGESVADQYPESASRMFGRVVSTIYVSVGLKKSWTLEYCLPAKAAAASVKGSSGALDAPWPYTVFRPKDLPLGPEADVVLVQGILTAEGQLEQLRLVLPSEWAGKNALFNALQQWKFRPAAKNGQAVAVEVMLVIPQQPEEE